MLINQHAGYLNGQGGEPVVRTMRLILGDQLSRNISSLQDIDPDRDLVLMVEVWAEVTAVRHHKQKIVLLLSAMRHFAVLLRAEGINVDYIYLDQENNTGSFSGEIKRALERHRVERLVVTEPGEWRVEEMIKEWPSALGILVEVRDDSRFLCSRTEFANWAAGRKALRMEHFYRFMRRQTGLLMNGREPEGGSWNYDSLNRRALPRKLTIAPRQRFQPDITTKEVINLVGRLFPDNFGNLEPFRWAVTRTGALEALHDFIKHGLPRFGDYQDAMKSGEDFLFHSVLSPYLNLGLLEPQEICAYAVQAYSRGAIPLPSAEGFLRQIIGWREYIRGVYWTQMPAYRETNFLSAHRPLPSFYWTGNTALNCLRETIETTRRNAYAHHIQRLMVTGNFALLSGIEPAQVEEWYLIVYADAFDWVELPNTHGMALYADGGLLGSKPYASSGAYINRMSDYCSACSYDPLQKTGPGACPFNYLYWYFLLINEARLKPNPRMSLAYRTLGRMAGERRQTIQYQAEHFLSRL